MGSEKTLKDKQDPAVSKGKKQKSPLANTMDRGTVQENDEGIVSHHHITEWLDVGGGRAGAAEKHTGGNAQRIGDADSKDQRAEDHVVHHNKNEQGRGIVEINEQPIKDNEQDQQSDDSV